MIHILLHNLVRTSRNIYTSDYNWAISEFQFYLVVAKQPHSLRSLLYLTHISSYPQKGVTKGPVWGVIFSLAKSSTIFYSFCGKKVYDGV